MSFFKAIRDILTNQTQEKVSEIKENEVHFCCAILLAEVARSDFEVLETETQMIQDVLKSIFSLEDSVAKLISNKALEQVEQLTSLHDYTQSINQALNIDTKKQLLTGLWKVAKSDGEISSHESHWIKRIADLLRIDRSFVFECKEKANSILP